MRQQERKALATLGRRGGKKAAERWKDPESDYAQKERVKLAEVNRRRSFSTEENKGWVMAFVAACKREGYDPASKEVAAELGLRPE